MKIGLASDHGGYELKQKLIKELEKSYELIDFGTNSTERTDYPIYAFKLGEAIKNKEIDLGIALCTKGIGMTIALNKVKTVRAGNLDTKEDAYYGKNHNNLNVIVIDGSLTLKKAIKILNTFLITEFNNDTRYQSRNDLISNYEANNE